MRFLLAIVAGLYVLTVGAGSKTNAQGNTPGNPPKACVASSSGEVWLLKTSGSWRLGNRNGYYRATVIRRGIEHAIDWVQVQIVEADDKANVRKPGKCWTLETPGLKGYVTDLTFTQIDDSHVALGIDIEMKAMENLVLREIYILSAKGEAKLHVEAKYKEVDL